MMLQLPHPLLADAVDLDGVVLGRLLALKKMLAPQPNMTIVRPKGMTLQKISSV